MFRAKQIYQNVINEMQYADEIEGIEDPLEYQALMRSIILEASKRLKTSQSNMETQNVS
jgi:hypothetical protein